MHRSIVFDPNDIIIQVTYCFQSDLCQCLWITGKSVMANHWAMTHRLNTTVLAVPSEDFTYKYCCVKTKLF